MPRLHFWCFSSCKTGVKSILFFLTVPRTTPARVSGGGGSHSELVITWEVTKQALAHTFKCTKVAVNGGRPTGLYLKQTHHAVSLVGLQFNFKKKGRHSSVRQTKCLWILAIMFQNVKSEKKCSRTVKGIFHSPFILRRSLLYNTAVI